jgi:predicted dehydrogenase
MQSKLRFLISGPGLIGKQHARLIEQRDDCELVAIVAPDHAQNQEFAATHSARFYTSLSQALADQKIDACIISSPNAFHYDQAVTCLSQGIPCLVEKPVTDNLEKAAELVELVKRSGVPLLVGHHRRHSFFLDKAVEFLRSEQFGRLVALQGSALFYKPASYFMDGPWRAVTGGGPILINLIHEVDLMRQFGGEIATVQALAGHEIRNFEVEDTVSVGIKFRSGALGSFLLSDIAASSKSWEMTSGENPAYPHFPDEACYHFAGTNGSLDFPSMQAKTYPGEANRSWWKPFEAFSLAFERRDPLTAQLDHFVDVIRNGTPPRVTAEDGYRNMLVIGAISRSIETRTAIDL